MTIHFLGGRWDDLLVEHHDLPAVIAIRFDATDGSGFIQFDDHPPREVYDHSAVYYATGHTDEEGHIYIHDGRRQLGSTITFSTK